ncbi:MAG TPA: YciI family protein [Candidatus Dormibacteraeota bacterium]
MLLFIKDETEVLDEAELKARYAAIDVWFGEIGRDGKLQGGEELQPSSTATTIRWRDGSPLVTDGPFMESKETVAGFVTVDATDLDDAIAITKRWPVKNQTVEIRPVIAHEAMPNHPAG